MRDRHDDHVAMPTLRALVSIVHGDSDRDSVLSRACEVTRVMTSGADAASVTLIDTEPRTIAAAGGLASLADKLQYDADEGPCLDAARSHQPVGVANLCGDDRWPGYRPRAVEAGVRGSLSLPLELEGAATGALNIYAITSHAFEPEAVEVALELARYTGIVATVTDERDRSRELAQHMQQAMEFRAVIEQAKGILMGQRQCTADEAFDLLVRLSQESHRKRRDVARLIVEEIAS